MKKLFAMLLALVMCLALCVPAFAETQTTYQDMSTVVIKKTYEATNAGTVSPAEEFKFTIERTNVTDAAEGVTAQNMPLPTIVSVSYAAGEAGSATKTKNVTISLPEYASVGIYYYTIKETTGSTAGVEYHNRDIMLKVTVIEQNGKVRVAAVHTETSGDKSDTITNTYSAGKLNITKTVSGIMGDKTKYFEFKVTLTGETGKTYGDSYAVTGGSNSANPSSIVIGTETTFLLKHGETISIADLPYGVSYTVTETAADGYTTTKTGDTGSIAAAEQTAAFTNDKGGIVDMGVTLESLPYVLALVIVAGGVAVMFARKRRVED